MKRLRGSPDEHNMRSLMPSVTIGSSLGPWSIQAATLLTVQLCCPNNFQDKKKTRHNSLKQAKHIGNKRVPLYSFFYIKTKTFAYACKNVCPFTG